MPEEEVTIGLYRFDCLCCGAPVSGVLRFHYPNGLSGRYLRLLSTAKASQMKEKLNRALPTSWKPNNQLIKPAGFQLVAHA